MAQTGDRHVDYLLIMEYTRNCVAVVSVRFCKSAAAGGSEKVDNQSRRAGNVLRRDDLIKI